MTRWFYVSVVATIIVLAASIYVYFFLFGQLPDKIPVHWNIRGEPDRIIAKQDAWMNFWLTPAIMIGLLLLTLILPWLSPRSFSIEPFRDTYGYILALLALLFAYIHGLLLWSSLHPEVQTARLLIGGVFVFFALLGNVLGRVRRNFWVGIRTPWTLASEKVWNATHRLGAWLFVACGVIGAIVVLAGAGSVWCFIVSFAGLMLAALVPVIYSLVLYKRLERQGRLNDSA
jgi:uncharacterized membrane protein